MPMLLFFACSLKSAGMVATSADQFKTNLYFDAKIKPYATEPSQPFDAFVMTVTNKSTQPIYIMWDETLFIEKGKTNQGFYREGEQLPRLGSDREMHGLDSIIYPQDVSQMILLPQARRHYSASADGKWEQLPFQYGENGVYLKMKINEEFTIREWLSLDILPD